MAIHIVQFPQNRKPPSARCAAHVPQSLLDRLARLNDDQLAVLEVLAAGLEHGAPRRAV